MSEKSWEYKNDKITIIVEKEGVEICIRDRYEGQIASIILREVETISEIIEHLKTFMSKPIDSIKRSEIPTVENIRLRLKEKLERDNEAVDKLVKHYTLKITEVMRKQEPTDDLAYFLHCDPLSLIVFDRLANNLLCHGWVLQYEENPLYPHSSPYEITLRWKPMNEEK